MHPSSHARKDEKQEAPRKGLAGTFKLRVKVALMRPNHDEELEYDRMVRKHFIL